MHYQIAKLIRPKGFWTVTNEKNLRAIFRLASEVKTHVQLAKIKVKEAMSKILFNDPSCKMTCHFLSFDYGT